MGTFAWLQLWEQVSNTISWSFCRWERGQVMFMLISVTFHVTLLLQTQCRRWARNRDEILFCGSQDSSLWSSTPRKSLHGLRFVPTDFTHGVSSSSHDFRIQSHLFTCDSHVCDRVFQAHVNNMWSILRSYDPHKPMCPKPSLSVPIGYPTVWNEVLYLLLLLIFSQQNSDKVHYCRDFVLN